MKRARWLLTAGLLLLLAAWLMRTGEELDTGPKPRGQEVHFPRHPQAVEIQRRDRRRTLLPPPPPSSPDQPPTPAVLDPVLRALPPMQPGTGAMVIEANAIRHSPAAEMLLRCMNEMQKNDLEEVVRETGIDPLEDVDRIAVGPDRTTIISGYFDKLDTSLLGPASPYGDHGAIHTSGGGEVIGRWNDELLIMAPDEAGVQAAIDRLESRGPAVEPPVDESESYGEAYGHVTPELLARVLPDTEGLEEKLTAVAKDIELHVDASSDVALVAEVRGEDTRGLEDLGLMIGGALAVARIRARAEGDEDLSELLETASVRPEGGSFSIELAMPLELLRARLGPCAEESSDQRSTSTGGSTR